MYERIEAQNCYYYGTQYPHSPAELLICGKSICQRACLGEEGANGHHDQAKPQGKEKHHGQAFGDPSSPYCYEQGRYCRWTRDKTPGNPEQKKIPFAVAYRVFRGSGTWRVVVVVIKIVLMVLVFVLVLMAVITCVVAVVEVHMAMRVIIMIMMMIAKEVEMMVS